MPSRLSPKSIKAHYDNLTDWELADDLKSISKTIQFDSFEEAMRFVVRIAEIATEMNHHPNWSNSYKMVSITLTTFSINGLSELDFRLAQQIDKTLET